MESQKYSLVLEKTVKISEKCGRKSVSLLNLLQLDTLGEEE